VGSNHGQFRIVSSTLSGPGGAAIGSDTPESVATATDTINADLGTVGPMAFTSAGTVPWNLSYTITDAPAHADIVAGAGTRLATDPKLGPLQDNGGPTLTRLPLAGSPAIDAGDPAFVADAGLPGDQRGLARPSGGRVDIGATEVQQATSTATLPATGIDVTPTAWIAVTASATGVLLLGAVLLWRRSRRQ
jgi:LPXTG-motif cell wall-anchored protein